MRQADQFGGLVFYVHAVIDLCIACIHHDDDLTAIGVSEACRLQLCTVRRYGNPFCSGLDELGEMPDVVVAVHVMQAAVARIAMHGRKAEVLYMVRAAGLIEQDVPVDPGYGAVVEIGDHAGAVVLAPMPFVEGLPAKGVVAGFGEQQVCFGEGLGHELHVLGCRGSCPAFIPVKTDAPDIFGRFLVGQDRGGPVIDQVAVMVPGNELLFLHFILPKRWPQEILDEIAFFLGRVHARFPFLLGHGLILNAQSPYRHSPFFVFLDKSHVVIGPGLVEFLHQQSSLQHVLIVFHPCRRAPGAHEHFHVSTGGFKCLFNERNLNFTKDESFGPYISGTDDGPFFSTTVIPADLDNDGDMDVYTGMEIYINTGEGNFINLDDADAKEVAEKLGVSGQALIFLKGDQKVDLTSEGFMNARNNPEKFKEKVKETVENLI